jgi:hypothetical protein
VGTGSVPAAYCRRAVTYATPRSSVTILELGRDTPGFPSVVGPNGIGCGALGALSVVPGKPSKLYSATDAAYTPTRILTLDTGKSPAEIITELVVTDAASTPGGSTTSLLKSASILPTLNTTEPHSAAVRSSGTRVSGLP